MTQHAASPTPAGQGRKLVVFVVGLAAVVVAMLCAFVLPSIHSGPHEVPVGVTGPQSATAAVSKALSGEKWEVTAYDDEKALTSAIEDRDVMGGIALSPDHVTAYTATAGGPQATAILTSTATALAEQQQVDVTVTDLKPFPEDDPKGAGFSSATLPMIFGGMIPAVALSRLFPGHSGLRLRLAGGISFALVAGFAVAALLQFGTGSLSGNYWITSLGISLGMTALSLTLLGLESLMGMAGFGLGAAVIMFLGNPLSGLASGPHWLPDGWATLGQLLPPGASGSLLRANAYFDGVGAGTAVLTLSCWVVFGLALCLIADRRGRRKATVENAAPAPRAQLV
ncbi:hypothetical protein [Streptomyces sp. PSKA30]|uniref:hypothetical protein n=1 Tax=Streptomyces sp. PSKA30 TaxID=2874597 RepID=UPI001CD06AB1|nr:hypothetical protein [Streptomyces sp. PSKA30]MBZ9638819.1 hypothetical protein [Streptomyces sp. PSKA30]